jgi:hypothetical protein
MSGGPVAGQSEIPTKKELTMSTNKQSGESEFEAQMRELAPDQFELAGQILDRVRADRDGGEQNRKIATMNDAEFQKFSAEQIRKGDRAKNSGR